MLPASVRLTPLPAQSQFYRQLRSRLWISVSACLLASAAVDTGGLPSSALSAFASAPVVLVAVVGEPLALVGPLR